MHGLLIHLKKGLSCLCWESVQKLDPAAALKGHENDILMQQSLDKTQDGGMWQDEEINESDLRGKHFKHIW